jgi:hypothetical protein
MKCEVYVRGKPQYCRANTGPVRAPSGLAPFGNELSCTCIPTFLQTHCPLFPLTTLPMLVRSLRRLAAVQIPRPIDHELLRAELIARNLPYIWDQVDYRNSDKLITTLASYVPLSWLDAPTTVTRTGDACNSSRYMAPSFHLVYFNPVFPTHLLLPDGTDPSQSPGEPFVRRMWAGGRVRFNPDQRMQMLNKWSVCVEGIRDVIIKGPPGTEKVFVGVERRMFDSTHLNRQDWHTAIWPEDENDVFGAAIVERRNLVFMRERTREELAAVRQQGSPPAPEKMLKRSNHHSLFLRDTILKLTCTSTTQANIHPHSHPRCHLALPLQRSDIKRPRNPPRSILLP